MKPHKHAELIKLWADGAEIEYKFFISGTKWSDWLPFNDGCWSYTDDYEFRIKPEPKPDWDEYLVFFREDGDLIIRTYKTQAPKLTNPEIFGHLKVTIDGETGKLKSVEVLK